MLKLISWIYICKASSNVNLTYFCPFTFTFVITSHVSYLFIFFLILFFLRNSVHVNTGFTFLPSMLLYASTVKALQSFYGNMRGAVRRCMTFSAWSSKMCRLGQHLLYRTTREFYGDFRPNYFVSSINKLFSDVLVSSSAQISIITSLCKMILLNHQLCCWKILTMVQCALWQKKESVSESWSH